LWGTLRQISAAAKSRTGIGVHDSINEVGQLIAPFTAAAVVNNKTNQKNSVANTDTPWPLQADRPQYDLGTQRKVAAAATSIRNRTAAVSRIAIIFLLFVF
jgi:hypothetical protein